MALSRSRIRLVRKLSWVDFAFVAGAVLMVYALIGVAQEWSGPYRPKSEISLSLGSLFHYSLFSLVRVFAAYLLSLAFTFTYGYWAAKSRRAEPILVSILDILQSVPVLGFMPGLVLALVNLFPNSNLGLELATVLMVFTCEGWNMVFSFYTSVKTVPQPVREMGAVMRMKKRDVFYNIELPFAMSDLLWNSMLSMAGGWFYLMVMESFTLGDREFRLPGIGSYMAVAYERGDGEAIFAGIVVMLILIVLVDRVLWAPLVTWADRFRFERTTGGPPPSIVYRWIQRSNILSVLDELRQNVVKRFESAKKAKKNPKPVVLAPSVWRPRILFGLRWLVIGIGILGVLYGARSMLLLMADTEWMDWVHHLRDTFFTMMRVTGAVLLGSLWTIPVGVFIGINPIWSRRLQPVVQVVASFPAPMVFPAITFVLIQSGVSFEFGSVVLMLFASQWYILFNVISGATRIPSQMLELADVFQVRGFERWRSIILPAILPSLVTGWITAAGGAWNACIVSELVSYGDVTLAASGIGASITEATRNADYSRLAGATITLIATVVLLNRFFWGYLYRLAETRFRLD